MRTIHDKKWWLLGALLTSATAQAQLSNNLSIGNPVSIGMANAVTARPPGTDAIHFNPAGLASINQELKQYKLQLAHTRLEGTVSGRAPGEPYGAVEDEEFSQDPMLQGQLSRPLETTSANIYLPVFGHVELPVGIAPGYGFATRGENQKFVFANSALVTAAGGFRRDSDNVGAYAGEKVGQTVLSYFNPTMAFAASDTLDVGVSVGFTWVGMGMYTQVRSVVQSLAMVDALVDAIDPDGNMDIHISPYSDVGWLNLELEDRLVTTLTTGLLWRPTPWVSFGMTYKTPATARLEGKYSVRYKDAFLDTIQTLKPASPAFFLLNGAPLEGAPYQSGDAKVTVEMPQTLSVGTSVLVTPQWRVNFDLRWIDYSVVKEAEVKYENPLDYMSIASMVNFIYKNRVDGYDWADPDTSRTRRNYSDVVDWALGTEYQYSDRLTLRFGIEPRTSPISETWMDLMQPLGDTWFYGTGFGWKMEDNGQLDVGVGYMRSDIRLEPGESRVANSMTEGETNSLYYRGMLLEHTTETFIFSIAYTKHI